MVWRFLKKTGIKPPYNPALPLLGIYPEETKIEKDTCTTMSIAALFTTSRIWKQPRCLSTVQCSSVQLLSCVQLFATPWTAAHLASLSITNSWSLFKLMSIQSVMTSNHLICGPLLLLPSIFLNIKVFSNKSVIRIRWPKYWSFSFSISPSSKYSGLISFRIDCFDLFAVQETLKNLLQHHSSKASILRLSACFIHEVLRGAKKGPGYSAC